MVGDCAASRITLVTGYEWQTSPASVWGHGHRSHQRLRGSASSFCVQRCMHTDCCGVVVVLVVPGFVFENLGPEESRPADAACRSLYPSVPSLQPPASSCEDHKRRETVRYGRPQGEVVSSFLCCVSGAYTRQSETWPSPTRERLINTLDFS